MYTASRPMASLPTSRLLRRLDRSLLALFAVALCAGLTLLAARPLPAGTDLASSSQTPTLMEAATDSAATAPQPQRKRTHVRRSRQTLAMPYFSFAAGN